jgi:hypothetical protein
MKTLLLILFIAVGSIAYGQKVAPLLDFSGYFKSFQNGFFRQIEFQRIKNYKYGDDVVGYIDNRGNLRVFDGTKPRDLANIECEYQVSDNLLVWKIASNLNLWDDGKVQTLTYFSGQYAIKDSMVVFIDTRFNSLNVYYNGKVQDIFASVTDMTMPDFVGENILAYRENGNVYKVFWRGQSYELGAWHDPIHFAGGTDVLAFNDPSTGTFAVFENGQFLDVEMYHVNAYKAGNGFIVYEDQGGNLIRYGNGKMETLTNYGASFWEVRDNVIIWGENGFTYAYADGKKIELARYIPEDYELKNGVIAFRNIMGGVSFLYEGKVHEITTQMNAEYSIHGNSLLVKLFNTSFIYFTEGKTYTL